MGALLVYFVIGSVLSVPVLGYHLLRTRRELSELRAELQQRGLIAPAPGAPPLPPSRGAAALEAPTRAPAVLVEPPGPAEPHHLADRRAG